MRIIESLVTRGNATAHDIRTASISSRSYGGVSSPPNPEQLQRIRQAVLVTGTIFRRKQKIDEKLHTTLPFRRKSHMLSCMYVGGKSVSDMSVLVLQTHFMSDFTTFV